MCMINYLSNCWKPLKLYAPQRRHETVKREGDESRKKRADGIRLNPKCLYNGQSAAKPRIGERSTTIPRGSTLQATGSGSGRRPEMDEDIVFSLLKGKVCVSIDRAWRAC